MRQRLHDAGQIEAWPRMGMVTAYLLFPVLSIYRMVEWLGWQPLILIPVLTLVWTARRAYGLIVLLPGVTRCQGRRGRRTPPPRFE